MGKRVFRDFQPGLTKPACAATEDSQTLEILYFERDFNVNEAKTNALISCAVTAQFICVFVSAYAKIHFSHDVAQIICCQGHGKICLCRF